MSTRGAEYIGEFLEQSELPNGWENRRLHGPGMIVLRPDGSVYVEGRLGGSFWPNVIGFFVGCGAGAAVFAGVHWLDGVFETEPLQSAGGALALFAVVLPWYFVSGVMRRNLWKAWTREVPAKDVAQIYEGDTLVRVGWTLGWGGRRTMGTELRYTQLREIDD